MKASLRQYSGIIKQIAIAIFVICLIASTSFVYGAMKKDITIIDNDTVQSISTFKIVVADVLKENNIQLGPFDEINADLNQGLQDKMSIVIKRANMITIETSEISKYMYTTASNVKTAIEQAGINVGEKDKIEPSLDTVITQNTVINITHVEEKLLSEVVDLAFENKIIKNENLNKGHVVVKQQGEKGQKQVSVKITYENGVEVGREVVEEKILKEPIEGIIEEGTRTTLTTSRGQTYRFTKAMTMTATAYDASYESCGKTEDDPMYGITYSGLKVKRGIVAVDPRVIPLGTWLYIEGYGEALAADIGGAIKGNKIDLYYESSSDVKKFGKKKLTVYVLDKPRYKFR